MNKNGLVYTIIFSFIVTFFFVFLLALANVGTIDIVEENEKVNEYQAVLTAMGIEFEAGNNQDILDQYEQISVNGEGESRYYQATVDDQRVYALPYAGPGLWGTIEVVVGLNEDLTRLTGLTIVSHSETPGLGGRIEDDWFKNQFAGQAVPEDGVLTFKAGSGAGDAEPDDNEVDAITGATRTTEGMAAIVAGAVGRIRSILGGNS